MAALSALSVPQESLRLPLEHHQQIIALPASRANIQQQGQEAALNAQ
jgi:hypothetical protein